MKIRIGRICRRSCARFRAAIKNRSGPIQAVRRRVDFRRWERELLEHDGSCRDITFAESLTREAGLSLLNVLSTEWSLYLATDFGGAEESPSDFRACLSRDQGYLYTLWEHGAFIRQMQCLMHWDKDVLSCELTFFPRDIVAGEFSISKLTAFLDKALAATDSTEYYVRYENASWRHGDITERSGVIFSHHDLPLAAAK